MKLVTFKEPSGRTAPGALHSESGEIVDLGTRFPDMLALIRAGEEGLAESRHIVSKRPSVHRVENVKLLAPLPVPESIRDCSVFEQHLKNAAKFMAGSKSAPGQEGGLASVPPLWYRQPPYYKGNRFSVIGPQQDIIWPPSCERLDFELEVAIVIGRQGRDIPRARAHEYIFGYMIFNDMSARDFQALDMQQRLGPAKGKDFDTGNVMGPWLVTRDEIADPYALTMAARLNGEHIGGGSTADMYHKWDAIIEFISRDETLYPGEVIGSGTVGGGTLFEHGRALRPGDVIEFEVTGLGTLRNRVVRQADQSEPQGQELGARAVARRQSQGQ